MTTRRSFIITTTAGIAVTCLMPYRMLALPPKSKSIGLQLYTVRDLMKKDMTGTLKQIAQIGYKYLEAADYHDGLFYGLSPREFRGVVEDLGMKLISSHTMFNPVDMGKYSEDHIEAGIQYIVLPYLPKEKREKADDYKLLAEDLNRSGQVAAKMGIRVGYHNHAFEFDEIDGIKGYDTLLDYTDPDLVTMQLDLFWIVYAGYDPIDYFMKYPGRFGLWHIKDMNNEKEKKFIEVGEGIINFKNIFKHSKEAGMNFFFVEQDQCDIPEIESITTSYNNLKSLKL